MSITSDHDPTVKEDKVVSYDTAASEDGAHTCRALDSATYSASVNLAKLSLMAVSWRPRPSAARRLSRGMVYPLAFFQLEMQGGIFQSCCSRTLTARGGECITGTGGDPVPRGTCAGRSPRLQACYRLGTVYIFFFRFALFSQVAGQPPLRDKHPVGVYLQQAAGGPLACAPQIATEKMGVTTRTSSRHTDKP